MLLFFWLLAKVFKAIFWKASNHTKLDNRLRVLFSRLIVVVMCVLGIFTVGDFVGVRDGGDFFIGTG